MSVTVFRFSAVIYYRKQPLPGRQKKGEYPMADNRCIYCERKVTPKNSPSQFDVYGNWVDSKRYPVICDECFDRICKK